MDTKWVFKLKDSENGSYQHKARLVAKGFQQKNCNDSVYTPVARLTTFRVFVVIATQKQLPIYQMDVTGAFLYGEIKEDVYIKLPDGKIGKLNKSLYGLKNSPKYWYTKFNKFMIKEKFVQSINDFCLYYKIMNNYCIFVLIYVDDLLICGSCENQITKFKALLHKNFKMKDLGIANNFLGININQNIDNGVVILNQKKYLEKILQKFQMLNCKEISTPIEQNLKFDILNRTHSENEQIENKCRQLIGSLLYACSATRPDLCVAVSFLSRYQHCASQMLYKFLKRVLRYVKGTLNLSLIYKCNQKGNLIGNVDADWAGDTKDRKSTSGFIFKIFNCPVSW